MPSRRLDRIRVHQNRVTGSWRVAIGGRLAYYCRTWDEAMDRAEQIVRRREGQDRG